jgi:hypothetical protein
MIDCNAVLPGHAHSLAAYRRVPDPRARLVAATVGLIDPDMTQAARLIEHFVDYLIRTERDIFKPGRRSERGEPTVTTTRLGKAFFQVLPLLGLFSSDRYYPARVYVFLDACWYVERTFGIDCLAVSANPDLATETYRDELTALIDHMRMNIRSAWFWQDVGGRQY